MRILFTGASSFTGYWFVKELVNAGHEVTALFQKPLDWYEGVRRQRVERLIPLCQPSVGSFGDAFFLGLAREKSWDLFCHHAANVTDYKSLDFDVCGALKNNTRAVKDVLEAVNAPVVLTGSVFEQGEGEGTKPLRAFSPYGLSKGLTAQVFQYWAAVMQIPMGKFVISNPFGPYEEYRFTSFLIDQWMQRNEPEVKTPDYFRDNIHVSLLAKAYVAFVEGGNFTRLNPSGYCETQGEFAARFAQEMRPRLNLECCYTLGKQKEFSEPLSRINFEPAANYVKDWNDKRAWDKLASYYQEQYRS